MQALPTQILVAGSDQNRVSLLVKLANQLRPGVFEAEPCDSIKDLKPTLEVLKYDVVLIDISDDEGADHIEAIEAIAKQMPVVVLSQHDTDAMISFEIGACDFVLTSEMTARRVQLALDRAAQAAVKHRLLEEKSSENPSLIRNRKKYAELLKVEVGNQYVWVPVNDIRYAEANKKYTQIHWSGGSGLIRLSLSQVYDSLDSSQFWRIHRSCVINSKYLSSIRKDAHGRTRVRVREIETELAVSQPHVHLFKDSVYY